MYFLVTACLALHCCWYRAPVRSFEVVFSYVIVCFIMENLNVSARTRKIVQASMICSKYSDDEGRLA